MSYKLSLLFPCFDHGSVLLNIAEVWGRHNVERAFSSPLCNIFLVTFMSIKRYDDMTQMSSGFNRTVAVVVIWNVP